MVGRVATLVVAVAAAAHAGPVTRAGVTWTAKPTVVHHDKAVALGWTVTARGTGASAREVQCVQFDVSEEYFALDKGKLVSTGGSSRRAEPASSCVPSEKTTVTSKTTWSFEVPPLEHEDLAAGEAVRARMKMWIGDKGFELGSVELVVGSDGTPKLKPRRP